MRHSLLLCIKFFHASRNVFEHRGHLCVSVVVYLDLMSCCIPLVSFQTNSFFDESSCFSMCSLVSLLFSEVFSTVSKLEIHLQCCVSFSLKFFVSLTALSRHVVAAPARHRVSAANCPFALDAKPRQGTEKHIAVESRRRHKYAVSTLVCHGVRFGSDPAVGTSEEKAPLGGAVSDVPKQNYVIRSARVSAHTDMYFISACVVLKPFFIYIYLYPFSEEIPPQHGHRSR